MTIPSLVYVLSKTACAVSLLLSIYAIGALLIGVARKNTSVGITRYTECFKAGKDARNVSLIFLAVLFFVTSKAVKIGALTLLAAIADIARLFAVGMITVLLLAFYATIAAKVNKNGDPQVEALCKSAWHTAIASVLVGLLVAYICDG